jgi:hypothetical protein
MAIHYLQCVTCKHFNWKSEDYVCAAFPGGIPHGILTLQHDHSKPFPGDNGIRYERSTPELRVPG